MFRTLSQGDIGIPSMDVLGLVNTWLLGPMFAPVELQQLPLLPLLQEIIRRLETELSKLCNKTTK